MFERFTEEARQVIVMAQQEAVGLRHSYIGTEHLLLGLLRVDAVAAEILRGLHVTAEVVRAQVIAEVGPGEKAVSGQIPFTPRSKKVLELSLQEAMSLGHRFISPDHILLGLMRENEGVAARILLGLDVDYAKVRQEVVTLLSEGRGAHAVSASGHGAAWPAPFWSVLNQAGLEIRRDRGRSADSGDLLMLLTCLPDGVARAALTDIGVQDAALDAAVMEARERGSERQREREPELEQAITIVQRRCQQAVRDGDTALASQLSDLEGRLRQTMRGEKRADWHGVMPRLRERLGLRRDDPPGERPAASGG